MNLMLRNFSVSDHMDKAYFTMCLGVMLSHVFLNNNNNDSNSNTNEKKLGAMLQIFGENFVSATEKQKEKEKRETGSKG